MASPQDMYDTAVRYHREGRFAEAEALYRQLLVTHPVADVYNNLGGVLGDQGRREEAIAEYRKALAIQPRFPEALNNLGLMLLELKRFPEAIAAFNKTLGLRGAFPEAIYNLGNAYKAVGDVDSAIGQYRRCIAIRPDLAAAHCFLGIVLLVKGVEDEGFAELSRAIELRPDYAEAYNAKGVALRRIGRTEDAIKEFHQAISIRPIYADAYNNLGGAFADLHRSEDAMEAYRRALEIQPDFPEALYNLATSLLAHGRLDESIALNRRALELKPDLVPSLGNLATALKHAGQMDEALECHRRALAIKPDPIVADNLLLAVYFHPGYSPAQIRQEHDRWNRAFAAPLARNISAHTNDRRPDRQLKIAYISPDFREHPVGRFMLALLSHHDRERYEITCYSDVRREDAMTHKLKSFVDRWEDVTALSDESLAKKIEDDRIDVLVDLTMHLEYNRMFVFARKPAPVQVTYLAYAGTTGLDTIDYRFSDPFLDPADSDGSVYSEKTFRLPRTYWCYPPTAEAPAPNGLPALKAGHISFGCLNNFAKVTRPTLDMWQALLHGVPKSTLTLFCPDGGARRRTRDFFASQGIDPERLRFVRLAPLSQYFSLYHHIDIALDPFPYCGGTTSCDALYMGVPLVTRTGQTAVSRGGLSILANLGLTDLITDSSEQYVQFATDLAGNLSRLSDLRATLRGRMENSPLMDAPQFARDVEAAYRKMWETWCATPTA
jgi:predicted O-linked N-acetylglucosamine transferase (SPINDLY family)